MRDYCELCFASELTRVKVAVRCLLGFVDIWQPTQEERGDLKLVLSELLFNAVIHGNNMDINNFVRVKAESIKTKSGIQLLVSIRDEGPGFNYRKVIQRAHNESSLMCESGRGMVLVCALTDNISFNKTGNAVRFVKILG